MAGGRPSVYKPEYAEAARSFCTMGATNETLAAQFEVSRSTIDRWIAAIPDFRHAVQQGREAANGAVVSALFARATGMERKMTRVFCHNGQPITVDYMVELPPDVRACMFWLRNRQPRQWRESRPLADAGADMDVGEPAESGRSAQAEVAEGAAAPEDQGEADAAPLIDGSLAEIAQIAETPPSAAPESGTDWQNASGNCGNCGNPLAGGRATPVAHHYLERGPPGPHHDSERTRSGVPPDLRRSAPRLNAPWKRRTPSEEAPASCSRSTARHRTVSTSRRRSAPAGPTGWDRSRSGWC
jgi:hypothetical protein